MRQSILEKQFTEMIKGLPPMVIEYRFCERRWRFDFAYIDHKIAVEIEGGVWSRGRHQRPKGFIADCEKYNRAAMDGWKVLRYTAETMGQAVEDLKELLKNEDTKQLIKERLKQMPEDKVISIG